MSDWTVRKFIESLEAELPAGEDALDPSHRIFFGGNIFAIIDEEQKRLASELDGPAREYYTTTAEVTMSNSYDHRYGAVGNLPANFRRLKGAGILDDEDKIISGPERIVEWGEWIALCANPRSRGSLDRPIFAVRKGIA